MIRRAAINTVFHLRRRSRNRSVGSTIPCWQRYSQAGRCRLRGIRTVSDKDLRILAGAQSIVLIRKTYKVDSRCKPDNRIPDHGLICGGALRTVFHETGHAGNHSVCRKISRSRYSAESSGPGRWRCCQNNVVDILRKHVRIMELRLVEVRTAVGNCLIASIILIGGHINRRNDRVIFIKSENRPIRCGAPSRIIIAEHQTDRRHVAGELHDDSRRGRHAGHQTHAICLRCIIPQIESRASFVEKGAVGRIDTLPSIRISTTDF